MHNKLVLIFVACVCGISSTHAAADIAADVVGLRECCPSLPILVNEDSVINCLPSRDWKRGYHMFGGSAPATRSCALECAFKKENLLTEASTGKQIVDMASVNSQLTMVAYQQWADVLVAAKANCTSKSPNITVASTTQKCTSGAYEVSVCLYKFMITSCPNSELGEKKDCPKRLNEMSLTWFQKIVRWFGKKTTTTPVSG